MPRTLGTPLTAPGTTDTDGTTVVFTAVDNANGDAVVASGNDLILVRNPTGGALLVTIGSAPDPFGRVGDHSFSIPATTIRVFGPYPPTGWRQADGRLYINGATGLEYAVIRLP
jgi:hypothetical protein